MKSMALLRKFLLPALVLALTGCVTLEKTSPTYSATIKQFKTIAVMPPDIEVYKLTAGGVRELIDEWSENTKKSFAEGLKKHLAGRYGITINFVDEGEIRKDHPDLWRKNKALYNAVSNSALLHAFTAGSTFPAKVKTFDYTLGPEIAPLAKVYGSDALLFIFGVDHEATFGFKFMNLVEQALFGVYTIVPSFMTLALVNGSTGNVEWITISPPATKYNFLSEKHMDALAEWMTRRFIKEK